jgi:hypothetical protein
MSSYLLQHKKQLKLVHTELNTYFWCINESKNNFEINWNLSEEDYYLSDEYYNSQEYQDDLREDWEERQRELYKDERDYRND